MSKAILRGLPVLLFLVGVVVAQQPGDLKRAEAERQIEAQRLEGIYTEALRRADAVGRSNPQVAIQHLKAAVTEISADKSALTEERRAAMLRKLNLDLKAWGDRGDTRPVTPGPVVPPSRTDPGVKDGKGQFDAAKDRYAKDNKGREEYLDLRNQRETANLALNTSVLKAGISSPSEITYPRDFAEKMAKRTGGVTMTPQEKAIMRSLGAAITVDYKETSFKDIIDDLQRRTGMPIVVDPRALEEANVKYETTLNLTLSKLTTRTVLKKILGELSLTYVVKDQTVFVTTPARARELLTIRAYSVADLMPMADMRMPLVINQIQAYQTLQQLVVLITQTVEPESWEVNGKGGLGTITFDPVRFMLIVKQNAEVHYLMGLSGR
jgi:hypothetical protein